MNYRLISKIVLGLILLITSFAIVQLPKIEFDYDFESYFPQNDSDITFFNNYRKKYESDNDFVLIVLENESGIFEKHFLRNVKILEENLTKIPRIKTSRSPISAKRVIKSPFGYSFVPYLHFENPKRYIQDSTFIFDNSDLPGTLIDFEAKSLAIYIKHEPYLSKVKSDSLLFNLESVLAGSSFDSISLAGRVHGQFYFIQRLRDETILHLGLAFVLVLGILIFFFRSAWGVLVPIAVVLISVIWLMAIMVFFGKKIDVLANLIPSIIFIVGMSDVVHIISKYLDEIRIGNTKTIAIKQVLKEVGTATFLTSLTTAIGFLSLILIDIRPIQDFAIYIALGVFISYALAFTLLPAILFLGAKPREAKNQTEPTFWYAVLHRSFVKVLRHYKIIPPLFAVFVALGLIGIYNIKLDNYLLEDLKEDDPIKMAYANIDNKFGGSRPLEISIDVLNEDKDFLSKDNLERLKELDEFVVNSFENCSYTSPYKILNEISQIEHNKEILALNNREIVTFRSFLMRNYKKFQLNFVLDEQFKSGRFTGRIPDIGGNEMRQIYQQLNSQKESNLIIKPTGTAFLIDVTNETLVEDVLKGLLLAIFMVSLIMGLVYKSFKMVLISIIPNIFPLIVVGALMAIMNIDLKISTSIIFTIAFGIAVDDTIHFMTKLKLELNKGKSLLYAMKRTYLSTGRAIILTSIILGGGFLNLIFSSFNSIYYIGILIGLSLFMAVIADLILLPALLIIFYKRK